MEGLKPGRIVYYVLSEQDAIEINRRRTTGPASPTVSRVTTGRSERRRTSATW